MAGQVAFIGITCWNSALFLRHALSAVARTEAGNRSRIVVWDNCSEDGSLRIAEAFGAETVSLKCSQADALNGLLAMAREPYVVLLHSDVILLATDWLERCVARLRETGAALLAPEDVGCGPYTRPFGRGMPESSFLFFERASVERLRALRWRRWHRLPVPRREVDFYGPHVTHRLPLRLAAAGLRWVAMDVQPSDRLGEPRYGPYPNATVWSEELSYLRYGLGNFYSIGGAITHYHNWYERIPKDGTLPPAAGGRGFPEDYIRDYTRAFLEDYEGGRLVVPAAAPRDREPVAL